ncbi:MAG: SDR family oxidoreductase [Imperialibacter sp.]|uniref:SDR family oxidoreductase n=1 Tax=Imperialibacter sp. TaxID=2038411 RepID=UPI0032EF1294
MDLDLKGRKALVCGSTQGIGLASAIELARLGAEVTLLARNEAAMKKIVAGLAAENGQSHNYLSADFSSPSSVEVAVTAAINRGARYDILINNTGGPPGGPLLDANYSQVFDAMEAHLHCNHILVQKLSPGMKEKKFGRIVNVISTSVKIPINGLGVSNTVRGAVASWAKTLSLELAPFGITVNNVLPGFTETERLFSLIRSKAEKEGKSEEEVGRSMKMEAPAGRFGTSEEIASLVAFLATPAAAYINGTSIPVDGGRTGSI